MLTRWGSFVYARRRLVLVLSGASLVLALALMTIVSPSLISTGWVSGDAESSRVEQSLVDDFDRGDESIIFLFDSTEPVADPATRSAIETAIAPLFDDSRVARVLTPWNGGNENFISENGQSAYAVAILNVEGDEAEEALLDLRDQVSALTPDSLTMSTAGGPAILNAITEEVEEGIFRAESVAVPLTILIQLLIFGSLIAAGLPLVVGAFAILGAIASILTISSFTDQSVFGVNIITMLGLALGVDYSLFMVARFREELRKRPPSEAVQVTMATVGKAILFSGITVIFGLAATWFFPLPALRSMGLAGMIVVGLALIYGLTLLPALLSVLGTRINAVPVHLPRRFAGNEEGRFWRRVAMGVMRRPVAVLVPVLVVLLLAGIPFLRLDLTPGGPELLPEDVAARATYDRIQEEFSRGEAEPIPVILTANDGNAASEQSLASLQTFVDRAAEVGHVTRVDSVLSKPVAQDDLVRGDKTLVEIVADVDGSALDDVVRDLRAINPGNLQIEVGGTAATRVDTLDGIKAGIVPAILFVVIGSYLILLLTFGSVFLPLKAIFMTLLSISASLGGLVFIFQDGRFENVLDFTATGQIISVTPILMFCILFGLSMDYEVLMLTRIQEEYRRTGNNTASVAFGLEKTAKVITGAAAIMIVAFGAFMLADIVIIKSMGFGLALAVLIDATIVRALLVPATMRLMGDWNWWAPKPIKALVDRIGLGHAEPARAGVAAVAGD